MRRGEVWWARQPEPIGRRPVVLLSRNEAYQVRNAVSVAQITTTVRHIPVEVPFDEQDGLPRKGVINLGTITTVPKSALQERICLLAPEKLVQIDKAIRFALDLG